MLISKFNRLIHNKILWGAFAVLVSLSMFGLGASFMRGSKPQNAREIGTLFGEPVTASELELARMGTRGFRPQTDLDEDALRELERRSWQRVAMLRKAKSMGIELTDAELAQIIQRDTSFQNANGVFSRDQYEQVIRGQLGIPVGLFESIVRQDLILQKLQRAVGVTLLLPPEEVNHTLTRLTDEFTVELAVLDFETLAPQVTLSDDEVKAYYDENTERFRTPETRTVAFIQWPVTNYLVAAMAEVETEEIENYYERNLDDFPAADTNQVSRYEPLEAVTNEIRTTLGMRLARFKAIEEAINLSFDIEGESTFTTVAEAAGMTVHTTSPFSVHGRIDEIEDVGNDFNIAVFDLSLDSEDDRIAEPIPGSEHIYLPRLTSITPTAIPPLEAIAGEVREQAEAEARARAFEEAANKLRDQLVAAVREGTDFRAAAKALGCKTERVAPFAAYQTGGAGSDPMQAMLAQEVIDLQPGEISSVISGFTGSSIAYVKSRTPSPLQIVDMLRPEVQQSMERFRGSIHFQNWADKIFADAGGMPEAELFESQSENDDY